MSIKFSKSFIYSQMMFWGIAFCGIGVFLTAQFLSEFERQNYQPYVSQYLEKPQNNLVGRYQLSPKDLVINGKLMVVNLNENKIDPIFNQLPKTLKPDSPEQVKTVLWIKCSSETSYLWTYADGLKGIENNCELTFVDLINHKYLWSDKVHALPPAYKKAGDSPVPGDPTGSVLHYLDQIPHKD